MQSDAIRSEEHSLHSQSEYQTCFVYNGGPLVGFQVDLTSPDQLRYKLGMLVTFKFVSGIK